MKKKLLIVVDYQNDFVVGSLGFPGAVAIEDNIASKIQEYRELGEAGQIIFTMDTHGKDYLKTQEGINLPVEHCVKGFDGWQLYGKVNDAKQKEDVCIEKPTFGSLELGNYLKEKSYQEITLVGVVSNICVLSNAIIVKSALPETPICIDLKGIASNDVSLEKKAIDLLKSLHFHIVNE